MHVLCDMYGHISLHGLHIPHTQIMTTQYGRILFRYLHICTSAPSRAGGDGGAGRAFALPLFGGTYRK